MKSVNLFAPASPYDKQILHKNLAKISHLTSNRLDIMPPPHKSSSPDAHAEYLNDTDRNQLENFTRALTDCELLWCIRGGYGSSRWVCDVNWRRIITSGNYPAIAGFSDVTFIHSAIVAHNGRSIHCPMPATLHKTSEAAINAMIKAFTEDEFPLLHGKPLKEGKATGVLAGGNLTCICHVPGTIMEPDWNNTILFLEECNEALYRIDRMLTWLLSAGILNRIRGLAIGSFSGTGASHEKLRNLFLERLSGINIPVIDSIPAGHTSNNMPLLMGGIYRLDTRLSALIPCDHV